MIVKVYCPWIARSGCDTPLGFRQRKAVPNAEAWLLASGIPLASPPS